MLAEELGLFESGPPLSSEWVISEQQTRSG